MIITLKHTTNCRDCGAELAAGKKARWYRNGDVYGFECHRWQVSASEAEQRDILTAIEEILTAARGPRPIPEDAQQLIAALGLREKTLTSASAPDVLASLEEIRKNL